MYFIAVRIANGLMKKKCENEQITFLQIQKVILHLLKKEFLLSSTQNEKLMEFNKEAGENEKNRYRKHRMNCKIGGWC